MLLDFLFRKRNLNLKNIRKLKIFEIKDELEEGGDHDLRKQLKILKYYDFDDWMSVFKEMVGRDIPLRRYWPEENIDENELIQYMVREREDNEPFYNFTNDDVRYFLRVFLEAFKDNDKVCYDITQLVENGYYDSNDLVCAKSISGLTEENIVNEKIIILIEGKTDKKILEESLRLLYPSLTGYYSFLDYEVSNNGGGADKVVYLVKSFLGVGLGNRVVAIFDNDTAAEDAMRALEKVKIPVSIKILKYPDIAICKRYPTIGPGGLKKLNINGLAASIELYLGDDVLKDKKGDFTPIKWKGLNLALNKYQGEIENKDDLQKKFFEKIKIAKKNKKKIKGQDWSGIEAILNSIFNCFS